MNPVDFNDPVESRRAAVPASRRIVIFSLVLLIVAVMIVWFGFLGWGAVEIVRSTLIVLKSVWAKFV